MKWFNKSLLILIVALCLYAVFSHGGLYDLWQLKTNISQTEAKKNQLIQERDNFAEQISLLQTSNFYAEKIAREELGMARKNEIVVYFKKDNSKAPGGPAADSKEK